MYISVKGVFNVYITLHYAYIPKGYNFNIIQAKQQSDDQRLFLCCMNTLGMLERGVVYPISEVEQTTLSSHVKDTRDRTTVS